MDELYDAIPDASSDLKLYMLFDQQKNRLHSGKFGTWKVYMHDRAITYRIKVEDMLKTQWKSLEGAESDGRWRLMQNLVVYSIVCRGSCIPGTMC